VAPEQIYPSYRPFSPISLLVPFCGSRLENSPPPSDDPKEGRRSQQSGSALQFTSGLLPTAFRIAGPSLAILAAPPALNLSRAESRLTDFEQISPVRNFQIVPRGTFSRCKAGKACSVFWRNAKAGTAPWDG
jgi:hypothetical protein